MLFEKPQRSRSVAEIFSEDRDILYPLLRRVRELQTLEQLIQQQLPEDLRPHCRVGNLRQGCLILFADSGVWATRLRYASPDLLQNLRITGRLPALRSIECRVQPPTAS